jgi:hypothetical protein
MMILGEIFIAYLITAAPLICLVRLLVRTR